MENTHEEAVVSLASLGCHTIKVISDDTDVFILLVHCYALTNMTTTRLMESTSQGRSLINIGATVAKYKDIASNLLSAHALTGCDTVACYYGIGKTKALEVLAAGYALNHVGYPTADMQEIIHKSTAFITTCYEQNYGAGDTMSDIRYKVWVSKTGRKGATLLPKLKALPLTTKAFHENAKRAHFQACIWKVVLEDDPPNMDPVKHGWEKRGAQNDSVQLW